MKDKLFPPIPGLLQSPFHIHLQFKERPNREKGARGRAWVIDHARGSHHLKADQRTEQGAPLTRELVSVTRCDASVTSTRVGGSLEAWITWGREQDSVTASWQGLAAHQQQEHPLASDSREGQQQKPQESAGQSAQHVRACRGVLAGPFNFSLLQTCKDMEISFSDSQLCGLRLSDASAGFTNRRSGKRELLNG